MNSIWYRKLTNGDEALFNKLNIPNDVFPVCLEQENKIQGGDTIKLFAVFRTPYSLLLECVKTPDIKRCFFEIIRGSHSQKHYVDIDIALDDDKFTESNYHTIEEKISIANVIVQEYITAIKINLPDVKDTDILVFNSNAVTKRSYHIIVDRWYFPSAKQNKDFFEKCMEYIPLPHRKYFDGRMYKSIQQFRLFLSTKCGKNRMKTIDSKSTWKPLDIITDDNMMLKEMFYASLITLTDNGCRLIHSDLADQSEFVPSRDLDDVEYSKIVSIFSSFKDSSSFDITGIKKGSLITLRRRRSSYCDVCFRTHDNEHPFLYTTYDNNVYFNCRRTDESQLIGNLNDSLVEVKVNNSYLPPSIGYEIEIKSFADSGVLTLPTNKPQSPVIVEYHNSPPIVEKTKTIKEMQYDRNTKRDTNKPILDPLTAKHQLLYTPQSFSKARPDLIIRQQCSMIKYYN